MDVIVGFNIELKLQDWFLKLEKYFLESGIWWESDATLTPLHSFHNLDHGVNLLDPKFCYPPIGWLDLELLWYWTLV